MIALLDELYILAKVPYKNRLAMRMDWKNIASMDIADFIGGATFID